jgi:hypothetical protein
VDGCQRQAADLGAVTRKLLDCTAVLVVEPGLRARTTIGSRPPARWAGIDWFHRSSRRLRELDFDRRLSWVPTSRPDPTNLKLLMNVHSGWILLKKSATARVDWGLTHSVIGAGGRSRSLRCKFQEATVDRVDGASPHRQGEGHPLKPTDQGGASQREACIIAATELP